MARESDQFEPVIGLEIHIQLQTARKLLSPEGFAFGAAPNKWLSAVTAAHPGTLPFPNQVALEYAAKLGLAVGSDIARVSRFDRKHYFYPDLPKGYQTTQDALPVCKEGVITFFLPDGTRKEVHLDRIHLEEDAGKSIHDQDAYDSLIDLNRAGVPLLEMVTKPVIGSPEEAAACFSAVRTLVRRLGICDGNMEEGSIRCDANISIRPVGTERLGTRVEIKNLNSFSFLAQAVHFEIDRQAKALLAGETIVQETRSWDPAGQVTRSLRDKESAEDYRYFPDPDQRSLHLQEADLLRWMAEMPSLPHQQFERWTSTWGIAPAEAFTLLEDAERADYFEAVAAFGNGREAANWMLGPVQALLRQQDTDSVLPPFAAEKLAKLIGKVVSGELVHHAAKEILLPALFQAPEKTIAELIAFLGLGQSSSSTELETAMQLIMDQNSDEVKRYRQGKKNLTGFFVGLLMRQFGGKADPKDVNEVVRRLLENG